MAAKEQKSKMLYQRIEIGIRVGKVGQPNILVPLIRPNFFNDFFFLILFAVFLMGFLVVAAIPFTLETATTNKKTIDKLNKELGFDLVERLMQVPL